VLAKKADKRRRGLARGGAFLDEVLRPREIPSNDASWSTGASFMRRACFKVDLWPPRLLCELWEDALQVLTIRLCLLGAVGLARQQIAWIDIFSIAEATGGRRPIGRQATHQKGGRE